MVVGFTSTEYTATGTAEGVEVCVEVLNPPSGGALRPFTVALLPHTGI